MTKTGRAALVATLLALVLDVVALRHAWASGGERLALIAAVGCTLAAAALLGGLWLTLLRRRRIGWLAAAAPALALAGALGATPLARARLGALAPWAVAAVLTAALGLLPRLTRGRAGALLAAAAGAALLLADATLPRRLYPSLRVTLLVCGFAALGLALARLLPRPRLPGRRRDDDIGCNDATPDAAAHDDATPDDAATQGQPRQWLNHSRRRRTAVAAAFAVTAALALIAGARALLAVSANVRFVAHAQAPAAGLILDGLDVIWPPRRTAVRVAATPRPAATTTAPRNLPAATSLRDDSEQLLAEANLMLITVDAMRADRLRPELTPVLAALARNGVYYRTAYAQAPHTAYSITTLLTAREPHHLDSQPPTLAEQLRARRWLTAAWYPAGLFFDGRGALGSYAVTRFGFEWADTRTLPAAEVTDAVLARLRQLRSDGEPRAFLWAHYFDPHEPYEPHDLPPGAPPLERYDAEVAAVDAAVGRLLAGLRTLARPTLVILTADHGEEFGEHGGAYHGTSVYDEQLRVPLVLAVVPGNARARRAGLPPHEVRTPVALTDVVPTAAALLGIPATAADGVDLDADSDLEPDVHDVHAQVHTRRMLLRGPLKLIHDLRRDVNELYDLAEDPGEQRNRIDARRALAAPLHAALLQWFNLSAPADLASQLRDRGVPEESRAAAARELGQLEAYEGREALRGALDDPAEAVRAEAALALGELSDRRARDALIALLDRPSYRLRAAVMLGRLREPRAAAALADACRHAADVALRRQAAHYLGFVGDGRAVAALLDAAEDPRVRGTAYVSLGRIARRTRSAAAATALLGRFATEDRADARADLAWALGLAGDVDAIAPLVAAATADPPLPRASEALVRLGAIARGTVGGLDFTCARRDGEPIERWLGATTCTVDAVHSRWRVRAPDGAAVLLLRARSAGDGDATLELSIEGRPLPPLSVGGRFHEWRLPLPMPLGRRVTVELRRGGAPVELDHLLLLPAGVTTARL